MLFFTFVSCLLYADNDFLNEVHADMSESIENSIPDNYSDFYYEYVISVYNWQFFTTKFLFWTNMILIGISFVVSIVHFYIGLHNKKKDSGEITISDKEIKIKTTWIGIILLFMSFLFLMLYMLTAYGINS
jgi:uncharacterized membrane protein